MSHVKRLTRYDFVSNSLKSLSDRRLNEVVDGASRLRAGIGGKTMVLEVEGTPVFLKQVPLTDLEREPQNVLSTANIFQLPTFYQYGVGSAGFGAWRELAAHKMTTDWVLAERLENFPLMYHFRVLQDQPLASTAAEQTDLTEMVAFWEGSAEVSRRLEAIAGASASIVLFLEYVPHNLDDWLTAQLASGDDAAEAACAMVEQNLRRAVASMNANGLWHFDAHFRNILTDGQRLYLADFGLALSPRFDLCATETEFLERHMSHDTCYVVARLVNALIATLVDAGDRRRFLRGCCEDGVPEHVRPCVAALLERYGPVAMIVNDFYLKLHTESRAAPYPADELRIVCDEIGLETNFNRVLAQGGHDPLG